MFNANTFQKFLISMLGVFALTLAIFQPARSVSALAATSAQMPLHFFRSADCTGEVVEISGTIHFVSQTQADGSLIGHFNYQAVTGVGLTSGMAYRTTAVDQLRLSAPFPASISSVQSFRLISQGAADNLLVTVLYHVTVSEAGEVTAFVDDLKMQCT